MKNQTQCPTARLVKNSKTNRELPLGDDAFYLLVLAVKYRKLYGAKALQQLLAEGA